MSLVKRFNNNPILIPNSETEWQADAVFNACPVQEKDKINLLYRAISQEKEIEGHKFKVSSIGYAESKDGINFEKRKQIIKPEKEWERFGCEDPRVIKIDNKYFIFYTALSTYPFSPEGIKVGMAITEDFKHFEKHPVTCFNSKAMTLFPERINGKLAAILSVHTDSPPAKNCLAFFNKVEDIWSSDYWQKWYYSLHKHTLALERSSKHLVEIGAPPIKTKYGWLLIYANVRNYFSSKKNLFGIEASLLDLENPFKVIGHIEDPLLIPQEKYEKQGKVPNIIFPSGALVKGDDLYIYYGGADSVVCGAKLDLSNLLQELKRSGKKIAWFQRYKNNPILEPQSKHAWETKAVFNPAAIYLQDNFHILYRAMSRDNTSVIGYAKSKDGFQIDQRLSYPIYIPREDFEKKPSSENHSGCEDSRIIKIGDSLYMTYTAYNGKIARVALTSIKADDFLNHNWKWEKPILISPPGVENKNCSLFSEKINNKYVFLHRPDNKDIWIDFVSDLSFFKEKWLGGRVLLGPRKASWDSLKIGAAAAPIKTESGWLLIYHGLSETSGYYRLGAVLLDLKSPRQILARSQDPIFEPRKLYEKKGQVDNVVFPCNALLVNKTIFIYYGGADSVVGVATISLGKLMRSLYN